MVYVVLYDYGPYDGGIRVRYASLSKEKAAVWLADHIKEFYGLEIRELPLEVPVDTFKEWH